MEIASLITSDFVFLEEDATLTELIGKLKQYEKRSAIVFKNKKYVGLVEKRKMLRSRLATDEAKVKHFMEKTPILSEHADVVEAAALLFSSSTDVLPVERNKVVIGVVSALAVALQGAKLPEAAEWRVRDIKLQEVKPLLSKDSMAKAIDYMHDSGVDQIPLVENGKLAGIISYRDVLRKYLNWSPKRDMSRKFNKMASTKSAEGNMPHLASLPVSDFCSTEVSTTVPTQRIQQALQTMILKNVTCLPVLQGEQVLGVLTAKQILGKIANLQARKQYHVQFIGLNILKQEPYRALSLQKVADLEAVKLQRIVGNSFTLVVHLKAYDKTGTRQKFSVHLRLEAPGQIITSSHDEWDAEPAFRGAFEKMQNELQKKFKLEGKGERKRWML